MARLQRGVDTLRRIMKNHAIAAWTMLVLTLSMKLVVPVGFMPDLSDNGIRLVICDGMATTAAASPDTLHAMHGHHHHHGHDGPAKPDAPCPFAGLTAPALSGADPIQLSIALAAVLSAALFGVTATRLRAAVYLRPPLRGPPHLA